MSDLLKLAIVGRPNVGKSTLFNRLAGRKLAIVHDQPGVTRDRKEAPGSLSDMRFTLVDTAGFEDTHDESLESRMRHQTELAVREADVILFMFDARAGIVRDDEVFARLLRKSGAPIVVVGNKSEGHKGDMGLAEAWSLGLADPVGISASHGEGLADLYQAIREALGEEKYAFACREDEVAVAIDSAEKALEILEELDLSDESMSDTDLIAKIEQSGVDDILHAGHDLDEGVAQQKAKAIPLAIVGRPNAGKSTLINTIIGDDRLLTGPEAGITRDSIMVDWEWGGQAFRLVDTAGLRKRAKVVKTLEKMSTGESIRSLKFADIVVLVMDSREAFEKQDLQLTDLVLKEGRAIVFAISKWDLVSNKGEAERGLRKRIAKAIPEASEVPIVCLSGLTGKNVEALLPHIMEMNKNWNARTKTGDLNKWLRYAMERHPPPAIKGKRIKPRYIAQIKARPPTFVLKASRGDQMPESYKRYLTNGIKENFGMEGTPIRLIIRQDKNPYARR